ncbi:MAG: nickel pincer cofactor biosynthesis protein LarC [Pirellulaceae bacterium]|nr:nickel pincer cofactor biosynthesis protein LarC [Pirellulaceae bacterium]
MIQVKGAVMRVAYLDCSSGISGDMTLGALIDAGVPLEPIQRGLDSLGLPLCRLVVSEVKKHGFRATHVRVEYEPEQKHRHLHHITQLIDRSSLTPTQRDRAIRIFQRLAEAEAQVHGTTVAKVHFHEVGAVDSIADIVGTAIAWELLGAERLVCSPIPTGRGSVQIAHGRVGIPAPATAELLRGIPLAASEAEGELTTPTGAAIVATLADAFGGVPAMRLDRIGYGAGTRDLAEQPNVLRLMVGECDAVAARVAEWEDPIWMLETNLDDVPGEWVAYCTERLLAAGALDVYTVPIQMKKNRPAVLLAVLCRAAELLALEQIIFSETGSLGIRRWLAQRHVLPRRSHHVATPWGQVAGKLARLADGSVRFAPEYESCRELAAATGCALRVIYQAAQQAFDLSAECPEW